MKVFMAVRRCVKAACAASLISSIGGVLLATGGVILILSETAGGNGVDKKFWIVTVAIVCTGFIFFMAGTFGCACAWCGHSGSSAEDEGSTKSLISGPQNSVAPGAWEDGHPTAVQVWTTKNGEDG